MSRCFRFPPPGYKKILEEEKGSVIIKRERDQAEKERRKEKKREKKEQKKREKIEKKKREKIEKLGANGEVEKKKQSHKEEGGHTEHKVTLCKEMKECEIEQLERSDLSEEHGQPAGILNLCDSSDSTQKSRKRKNRSLPSDGNHNQSTMLRIRLPLQRHKDPEKLVIKEQLCSTSGGTEIIAQKMADISSNLTIKQPCLDSGRIEIAVQDSVKHAAVAKLSTRKSITPQTDVQLRETLDNWVPSAVQFEQMDAENLEWLFDMPPSKHGAKRSKVSDGASCRENPSLWPRACYLPEVDIYALPYTVPY